MRFSSLCDSCAGQSITNLSYHKGPEEALLAFCQSQLVFRNGYEWGKTSESPRFTLLVPYYSWMAGPEVSGKGHSSSVGWWAYGTEFAAYIRKHRLGRVSTLGPKINKKYHPDTTCQVWIWSPDQAAVEKWYTKILTPKKVKVKEVVIL